MTGHSAITNQLCRLARLSTYSALLVTAVLLRSGGQTTDNLPSAPSQGQSRVAPDSRIVVPLGTSIPLIVTRPINSNDVHSGDSVFAQVSNPVMVNGEVAIPAGTFVRGEVEKLTRKGTRAEMTMHSAALVMGSAVVNIGGPLTIESEQWTAYNNPEGHKKAWIVLAPLVGSGLGMAIGAARDKPHTVTLGGGTIPGPGIGSFPGPPVPAPTLTFTENTHTGLFVGSAVGGAVGLVTSFTLMGRSHEFYLPEGSPLHLTLTSPASITRAQVEEGAHNAAPITIIRRVPVPVTDTSSDPGTCYTPGTPGTPDVVVPGMPATDSSPGTPSITIPGIPATPPVPHPCP